VLLPDRTGADAVLGKGRGHLHEMPDQLATLRSFVKWADRAEYPDVAPRWFSRAFQEMLSGRRGPASLEMPWDVFTQRAEVGSAKVFDLFPAPKPDPDRIKAAADLIKASKNPMILSAAAPFTRARKFWNWPKCSTRPWLLSAAAAASFSNAHELGLDDGGGVTNFGRRPIS